MKRSDGVLEPRKGSSLESVDSASCVKITRHDPNASAWPSFARYEFCEKSGIMKRYFCMAILFLVGSLARGEVEKMKPEDPQRSELEGKAFKAKKVIPDASPERSNPQLYRAWRNPPVLQTKRPGDKLLSFPQIRLSVKQPEGQLSAWDKKMWETGKPVRTLEVNRDFVMVFDPLSLKDFDRLVYKRNRNTPHGDSRKARQER